MGIAFYPHGTINTMFSTVITRSLSTNTIQNVVVMGGGLMGTGIAQVSAQANQTIALVDLNQDILNKAEKRIGDSLKRVAKKKFKMILWLVKNSLLRPWTI